MLTNSWNINFYFIFGDLTAFNNKYFCLYIFFGIFALLNIFINKGKKEKSMSRENYLWIKLPNPLLNYLIYNLGIDEFTFLMCLLDREHYINSNKKGEGFSVTNDAIKAALDCRMDRRISVKNTKKLNELRQSLAEKGFIKYQFDEDTNRYYYFIQWKTLNKITRLNINMEYGK